MIALNMNSGLGRAVEEYLRAPLYDKAGLTAERFTTIDIIETGKLRLFPLFQVGVGL